MGKNEENLSIEDWLVDLANSRGANVVFRQEKKRDITRMPDRQILTDEELVIALCQLNCVDRPQILRLAAQLISRDVLNVPFLLRLAVIERASPVLRGLADLALKVEPKHSTWNKIQQALQHENRLQEPLLHWNRLAEPQFNARSTKLIGWKLVA